MRYLLKMKDNLQWVCNDGLKKNSVQLLQYIFLH